MSQLKIWMISILSCFVLISTAQKKERFNEHKVKFEREKREKKQFSKIPEYEAENEEYDGPDKAIQLEILKTRDLTTGEVPKEKILVKISIPLPAFSFPSMAI